MRDMRKKSYDSELESLDFICLLLPSDSIFSFIQQEGSEAQTQILAGIRPHSERSFL